VFFLAEQKALLNFQSLVKLVAATQEEKNRECRANRQLPRNCEQRCSGGFATLFKGEGEAD
jgi:hypothetical protein